MIGNNKNLIILIGESASGKSTIEKELNNNYSILFRKATSHTTRPMREGEVHGIDYWYITEEDFAKMLLEEKLAEHSDYRGWNYGVSKQEIFKDDDKNIVVVVEPHGYKQLVENLRREDINIISFYVKTSGKTRLLRSLAREFHPDCKEICRRYLSDIELFDGIENKVDYVIDNNDRPLSVVIAEILNIIEYVNASKAKGFKIGDKVVITDKGEVYSTYESWVEHYTPDYLDKFCFGARGHEGSVGTVVYKGKHLRYDNMLYLIEIEEENRVVLIGETGLKYN